jgi:hypothetical protein
MNGSTSNKPRLTLESRRAIYKWILQSILGVAGYGVIIFLAAGTLDWVWGWLLLGLLAAFLAAQPLMLMPINPDLLVERGKGIRNEGVKEWDKWIAPLAGGVMPLISWIAAGLDVRFGWDRSGTTCIPLGWPAGLCIGIWIIPVGNGFKCLLFRGGSHPGRARPYRGHKWTIPICTPPWL